MKGYYSLFFSLLLLGLADLGYLDLVLAPQLVREFEAEENPQEDKKSVSSIPSTSRSNVTSEKHPVPSQPQKQLADIKASSSVVKEIPSIEKGSKPVEVPQKVEQSSTAQPLPSENLPQIADVLFKTENPGLSESACEALTEVAKIMQAYPQVNLKLRGHTDRYENPEVAEQLSQKRAQAVARFLIAKGVSPSRISTEGVGSTEPAILLNTLHSVRKNRRVELLWVR